MQHLDSLFRVVQEILEKRLEQDVFIQVGRIFELFTTGREALSQTEPGTVATCTTQASEFPLAAKYRVLLASVVERLFERLKVAFNQFFLVCHLLSYISASYIIVSVLYSTWVVFLVLLL